MFEIVDDAGRRARLADLAIALLEDDYPPVTGITFISSDGIRRIDWVQVREIDRAGRRISVVDLNAASPADKEDKPGEVLLRRDVLDALIIDLLGRRTVRSSDLMLSTADKEMRLKAVDAGLRAMLRRITRGLYKGLRRSDMYDWKYVEFLRGDPHAVDSGAGYRLRIGRLPAGEIAQVAEYVPYLHAAELLTLLPNEKAATALQAMSLERQVQVIEEFDEDEAVDLLARMSPDRVADLVGNLKIEIMKRYLGLMPKKQRERVIELLRYPENSVGGVMINNIIAIGAGTSVAAAREKLRKHSKERDFIPVVFVTENSTSNILSGTIAIRDLIEADDEKKLKDIMDPYTAVLSPFGPAAAAAYKVIGSQVAAMPVTDADNGLLGAMTIEAAISQTVSAGSGLRGLKVFS